MSYQQGPRRPQGRGQGYGRPPAPSGRPAYHQTRMMPLPTEEPPAPPQRPYDGPPPYDRPPPDGYQRPPGREGYPPPPRRRPPRKRRWGRKLGIVLLIILLLLGGMWLWLDLSINRVQALTDYPGRPAAAAGTNWLLVGSDSREGLTEEERAQLSTGDTGGKRTDTILIAHLPDNDTPPTLLSLPRDSEVDIPGHGPGKINAAFGFGASVLVQTVEQKTGLRIDHYAEISFGGFAEMVDAIGGVEMNIEQDMHDTKTGATIKAGQQKLDGTQALAFVRMRYSSATPRSDLDRVVNQRKFIGALASEIASPGTLLNPFDVFPLLATVPDALTIDEGDHVHHLVGLGFAMGGISDGGTVTTTVPVTSPSAKEWDPDKSQRLFDALRDDTPIPADVILN